MKKNRFSFIVILWWVLGAAMLGVLLLCFAQRSERQSVLENRMLKGFPEVSLKSVFSGEFSADFESWLSDGFFGRDGMITRSEGIMNAFSVQTSDDEYVLDTTEDDVVGFYEEDEDGSGGEALPVSDSDTVSAGDAEDESEDEASDLSGTEVDFKLTSEADEKGLYYFWFKKNNGKLEIHYPIGRSLCRSLADTLNLYRSALPDDGHVYYTIAPLCKNARYWVNNRKKFCGWYSNIEDGIQKYCGSGVNVVNTPAILEPHMLEKEYVYMKTDHHWTTLGAYYVFADMIASQGLPVIPYDEFSYKLNESSDTNSHGSHDILNIMYPLSNLKAYRAYSGELKKVDFMNYDSHSYMAYVQGVVQPWKKFDTGMNTGRSCLVIGDSFANAFAPFLTAYYDSVNMCDVRRGAFWSSGAGGNISALIKKYNIHDVYIVMSQANDVDSEVTCMLLRRNLFGY